LKEFWRPSEYRTAETAAPIVIRLFAENTVDQYVTELNSTKRGWFDLIFNEGSSEPISSKPQEPKSEADQWSSML